jgi:ribosomal protein S18 acetylase RimI-like enzyme
MAATSAAETVEYQAFMSWFNAVSRRDLTGVNWTVVQIGDAVCSVSPSEPSILVNRVLGLGTQAPPTLEQLIDIRSLYAKAGVGRFFLHVVPELMGPDRADLLTEAGYEKYRGWMKFSRGPGDVSAARTDLTIRQIGLENADHFAAIVAHGFDFEAAFHPALAALANDSNWHLYMTFDGDLPAGTGALYIHGGTGYLDFAATHPDFRRRGAQSAVLAARLNHAFNAGCTSVVTMTGEAVPGEEQHSYRNIERSGFVAAYLRENWISASR